jgi:hypothetical protein
VTDLPYGAPDVFVTKFTPDGTLSYSTLVGGSGADLGLAIAVDSSGNAYVAGATNSSFDAATTGGIPFPATSNAYLAPFPGSGDPGSTTFVFELNPAEPTPLFDPVRADRGSLLPQGQRRDVVGGF